MNTRQQRQLKILLLGDACTDVYHYGSCERISPEAPVPVFEHEYSIEKPGMALNVEQNFKGLGCSVDSFFNSHDLFKERFIDSKSKYQLFRFDKGETLITYPDLSKINKLNTEYDAIVVSDYCKGFVTDELVSLLRQKFKNCLKFVDTKRRDMSIYDDFFIKINKHEREQAYKFPNLNNSQLIVTLGEEGALWNEQIFPAVERKEVFDVTGAGDTFLAAVVYGYILSKDMEKAIKFANHCASVTVSRVGTHALEKKDYEKVQKSLCF